MDALSSSGHQPFISQTLIDGFSRDGTQLPVKKPKKCSVEILSSYYPKRIYQMYSVSSCQLDRDYLSYCNKAYISGPNSNVKKIYQ
jgi:hypothetical protein